jgi:hypothetical protein
MTLIPTLAADKLAVWQPLFSTIVGGVLAFGGAFAAKYYEHRQQRLALRAAFGAEISALLKITEIRKHETVAGNLVAAWKRVKILCRRCLALLLKAIPCMQTMQIRSDFWEMMPPRLFFFTQS